MKVQKPILKMKQKPNLVKKISKTELEALEFEADLADMMLSKLFLETAKLFQEMK